MNPYLVLMALALSSMSFFILTLIEMLFQSWLGMAQVTPESNLSSADSSFKGILKSLFFKYLLDFLVPLAMLMALFYFLPSKGIRLAVFFALLAFMLNASQLLLLSSEGMNLSFDRMAFVLFWRLLKYLLCFAVAGFVFSL